MAAKKEEIGIAKVVGDHYKLEGAFHRMESNTPIRREDGKLCGVTNPRDITHMHSYGAEAPFFENLSKGKLLATRCDNPKCEAKGSVFEPFRIFCPDCLERATILDLTEKAKKTSKVHSFMVTERTGAFNTLKKPIKFINIEFDGVCTILMGFLSLGEPKIGMKVVPIFRTKNPTYTILDLSWVPDGTKKSELPDGFSF